MTDDELLAEKKLYDFIEDRKTYLRFKGGNERTETTLKPVPKILALTKKLFGNIKRMGRDTKRINIIRLKVKTGKIDTANTHLIVEVMDRNALITDERLLSLWNIPANVKILKNFAEKELYTEVNATHWLMITGEHAGLEELGAIIVKMGHNPTELFSDYRGQNGGSLAIDNDESDRPKNITGISFDEEEKKYWQPLFTDKILPLRMRKWHMSRNHSVVYCVRDAAGKEILLLPMHVDPKNWVVVIKELFIHPKKHERPATDFHRIPDVEKDRYIGTGLYEFGAWQFIQLLRKKQPEIFCGLTVIGEHKLQTTRTVRGDEQAGALLEQVIQKI